MQYFGREILNTRWVGEWVWRKKGRRVKMNFLAQKKKKKSQAQRFYIMCSDVSDPQPPHPTPPPPPGF